MSVADTDNPWPGLATFTEDQSGLFHGRDAEIRDLARRTERNALTVLFGQSGLGKSSLLQAGVFPRLRAASYWPIYVRLDHSPGAPTPTEQVKALVAADTVRAGTWTKPGSAKPGEALWEFFHHRDDRLVDANGKTIIPVLVFDQFEELFTLGAGIGGGPERARAVAFIGELAELVENRPAEQLVARLEESSAEMEAFDFSRTDYRVVISLREDFLPHLESLKTIMPALMENRMRLARMTGTQALEAVVKPGGALVTPEVAQAIVEFVSGARGGSAERLAELDVEPPLLSVICRELNERRRTLGQSQITADLVSGNRREILTDFYERSVSDLPTPMRAFVEDRLLTKSGFRDNLALETALEEPGVTRPLLDALIARRLLRIEDRLGVQRVELTHDVLAEVIRASRDARQQRLALDQARAHEQRALAAAAHRTRKLRWLVGGLAAVIVALCAGGAYGLHARRLAFQSASRTDAAFASRLLEGGSTAEALAYFVRAARHDPHHSTIAPRLLSALAMRSFSLPQGAPVDLPAATRSIHYSRDGSHAWVLGADSVLRVVAVATRQISRELRFEQSVRGAAFPAENEKMFVVRFADFSLRAFDASTGQPLAPAMHADEPIVAGNHISADGRTLVVRGATRIFVWDTATGARRATIDFGDRIPFLALSPDGERLLGTSPGGYIRQWSTITGALVGDEIRIPGVLAGQAPYVGYSPDGRLFFVGAFAARAQLYESVTGRKTGPIFGPESTLGAEFSRDGRRLLVGGSDAAVATAHTWDVARGEPIGQPWPYISGQGRSLSDDGNLLFTLDRDGSVRTYDTQTGKLLAEPTPAVGKNSRTALSPTGQEFLVAQDTKLYFFRVGGGAARSLALRRAPRVMGVPFVEATPARVLWFDAERARVLDLASGREQPGGFDYPRPFVGLSWAGSEVRSDGRVAVVATGSGAAGELGTGARWEVWRPEADTLVTTVLEDAPFGRPPGANWIFFSLKGDRVALAANTSAQTLRVWSLSEGKPITPPLALPARMIYTNSRPASFSPDGTRIAAGGINGIVRVWELATGRVLFDLASGPQNLRFMAFSPDGGRIVTLTGGPVMRLWDGNTGQPLTDAMLFETEGALTDLNFSPDGRWLAVASGAEGARLYDGHSLEPFGETLASPARSIRFSRDGTRIATGNNATQAKIWDATTHQPLSEPMQHPGVRVVTAEFSPDGRYLRVETSDNYYHFWPVPPLVAGAPLPEWLLDLATICAGKRLTNTGNLENAPDAMARIDEVRRALENSADDAPYVEWGRWFLADRATRSIAPGFTITPVEAEKLAKEMAPATPAVNPEPTPPAPTP